MAQKIICRPCKRRLDKAIQFKHLIVQAKKVVETRFPYKTFLGNISFGLKAIQYSACERQFIIGWKTKKFGIY